MAYVTPTALDLALNYIKDNTVSMSFCATAPTDYASITSGSNELATVDGLTGTDFTVGAGDVSGRKVTVGAQTGISIALTGTIGYVALHNNTDTLYAVFQVNGATGHSVNTGETWDSPAFDYEIPVPVDAV